MKGTGDVFEIEWPMMFKMNMNNTIIASYKRKRSGLKLDDVVSA